MSHFRVEVIPLPKFGKHPNADSLYITQIFDYPVIFNNKENFKPGDLVAYIGVESMVPLSNPAFSFLDSGKGRTHERIKAKKLRGIFSMGLLIPAPEGSVPGQNVAEQLGIYKYEEPEELSTGGDALRDPGFAPGYTDIQNFRRYAYLMQEGEPIVATEKTHGANAMYAFRDGDFWVRSHRQYKKKEGGSIWWKAAQQEGLEEKVKALGENYCVFGEVYGAVQDLTYGVTKGQVLFRAFDIYDIKTGIYVDFEEAKKMAEDVGLRWMPELYKGPLNSELVKKLVEEDSKLGPNLCEGAVIRPLKERFNAEIGRVVLKLISQRYLLRKGGTEHH